MDYLVAAIVYSLKQLWPFVLVGLVIGAWATFSMRIKPEALAPTARFKTVLLRTLQAMPVLLPLALFYFGPFLSNALIAKTGLESVGQVVSTEPKRGFVNYERVIQSNVTYLKHDGEMQVSYFNSKEWVFYPNLSGGRYPRVGESFCVKYLPKLPRYFVIDNACHDARPTASPCGVTVD